MSKDYNDFSGLKYPDDMIDIIRKGLKKGAPKKILIAGGGMSGLVAASLLKQAGHKVTIIEGNNRLGGRIFTIRQPFTAGNYLDFGAMRIPNSHALVFEYIRRFKLHTNQFIKATPNDIIFVNNVRTSLKYYEQNPDILGFEVNEWEKGKTADELLLTAVEPFINLYKHSSTEYQKKLEVQYDRYSMENFLKHNPLGPSLSSNAIRMISVLLGIEGFKELSFIGILNHIILPIFDEGMKFHEVTGGNDKIPLSFVPELQNDIFYGLKIEKITQNNHGVHFLARNQHTGEYHRVEGDYAVVTIPFTALQFIDIEPYESISFRKRQAIRELQNIPSVKVGIEFKQRFWENYNLGNAVTDFPTRFSYIPSHNIGSNGPGVLLACYCWGHDSLLWSSLNKDEIIHYVLKTLAKIYGNVVYQEFLQGVSFDWGKNPYSAGCFTLYTPGQQSDFGRYIQQAEGRLHFAGEHTSSFPGWIEGAAESGIRAAFEVNQRDVSSSLI